MGERDDFDWTLLTSVIAGTLLCGFLLFAIGLPLSYVFATLAGDDPLASILLLRSGDPMASFLAGPGFGVLTHSEVSTVSAYLAMIGAATLSLPLLYAVARREGIVKVLTLSYGMYLGLSLALAWFEWSNTGRVDWLAPKAGEIAYLYLAFLIAEAAKLALAHKEIGALPYNYAIDGLFGTVAVLIIHAGYDPSFSSLLLGPFFLIAVALAMASAEWLMVRPGTILLVGAGQALVDPDVQRRFSTSKQGAWARLKLLLRECAGRIREMRRIAYAKRVRMAERALAKGFREFRRGRRSFLRGLDWRIAAVACAGNLAFLLCGLALARLVR